MKSFFFFLCLFFLTNIYSQDINLNNEGFKIKLNVILPENLDQFNDTHLSRFNSKITNLVSEYGISGDDYSTGSFAIYPKILINEVNAVETGISNVYTANIDVSLYIKQLQKNTIFSSITFNIKGYGNSKDLAISNAIQNIPTNNEKINSFFINSKKKIIDYFNLTCNDIITKSSTLSQQKKYDQAISILIDIPEEVNCFNKVQESIIKYYKLYQESVCSSLLQKAKTRIAARAFIDALNVLNQIDPSTTCKIESDKLISICENNINEDVKRERRLDLLKYKNDIDLEKRRIDAARQIAIEYFKSRPRTITYNNLILY